MKNYKTPIILFAVFEIIAISLWLATGSLFYLLNFSYIGTIIGVGLALSKAGGRRCASLSHRQNLRASPLRARLVWLCLLDGHDP